MPKFNKRFWDKPQLAKKSKEPRYLEEVNVEYTQVCAQLGQCRYRISTLEIEAARLESKIAELELEGRSSKPKEEPKKEEVASNG